MQRLRQQVDRIDLKMIQLLQQRTKLSGEIGEIKRRHGAVVYVPERERELVMRLGRLTQGQLPARAIAGIYREILSSSRAAQGQMPIGVLQSSASAVLPASLGAFGACDRFAAQKKWTDLSKGLETGALSLALLTGEDLARALGTSRWRKDFFERLTVAGDFVPAIDPKAPLARRIFIVKPRGKEIAPVASRILILIECKSTLNAIKSLFHSMPDISMTAEQLTRRALSTSGNSARRTPAAALVRLMLAQPIDGTTAMGQLIAAGKTNSMDLSILGIYSGTEDYGG
jgi:chorismate mutase